MALASGLTVSMEDNAAPAWNADERQKTQVSAPSLSSSLESATLDSDAVCGSMSTCSTSALTPTPEAITQSTAIPAVNSVSEGNSAVKPKTANFLPLNFVLKIGKRFWRG